MGDDTHQDAGTARDRAATHRDVDAGVRDRLAGEEIPDEERAARSAAARDRMAAMQDRQASARERRAAEDEAERRRADEPADDA